MDEDIQASPAAQRSSMDVILYLRQ